MANLTDDEFLLKLRGNQMQLNGEAEFAIRLRGGTNQPAVSPQPIVARSEPLPASLSALDFVQRQQAFMPSPQQPVEDMEYQSENAQPGVPLDTQTGADALTRLRLGAERNKIEQLNILREMHGPESVRLDKEGNFIFRTSDDAGKPKDILVDERKMSAKDFLDFSSEFPAFAMSMLTTKGVPASKIFQTAFKGALGYFGGGAATDVASRSGRRELDIPEILSKRGSDVIMDTLSGGLMGKGLQAIGSVAKLTRIAASKLPEIGSDATKAGALAEVERGRQETSKRTGITLDPTMGELTGNPMFQRLEAFLSNIPIARRFVLRNWQRQIENEKAIQNSLLGGKAPDPDRTGTELIDLLGGEMKRGEAITGKAADIVRRQTTEAITDPLSQIKGAPLTPTQFGSRMIRRGEAQLESFKTRAREKFDLVRAQPDSNELSFDVSPIKKEWSDIKKSDLVSSASTGEPIKSLAPSGVGPLLDAIDELPDRASYFDLVHLRNSIYDRIDSPEPISSKGTQLLKRLGATITKELSAQGKQVLNPNTQSLLKDANQFYAQNVDAFYQKGVAGMLKPRTEAGAIDPERIAAQLMAGGKGSVTTYNTFKSFFEKPKAIQDMNRLLRDQIIESGTDQATGLIKLEALSESISKLQPEIVKELFGKEKDVLLSTVRAGQTGLRVGTKGFAIPERGTQAAVEADQLKSFLDEGGGSVALKKMITSREQLRTQYGNVIRKSVAENDFGVIEAAPETFVDDYLLNPSVPFSAVKDVMGSVYRTGNTDLIADIRRIYLGQIFNKSAKTAKGEIGQIVGRVKGSPLRDLDPQKFAIALEDQAIQKRMQEILGQDTFETLKAFAVGIGGRAARDLSGTVTGAFKGGTIFERLLSGTANLPEIAQYSLLSYMLTSPDTLKWLKAAGPLVPKDMGKVAKAFALTPEFFRALSADATSPQEAYQVTNAIKKWAETNEESK